jgi:TPR repeat protein
MDGGLDYEPEQAVYWLTKAAAQGWCHAALKLSYHYLRGSGGLPVDEKKAYDLTMQAAEAGM